MLFITLGDELIDLSPESNVPTTTEPTHRPAHPLPRVHLIPRAPTHASGPVMMSQKQAEFDWWQTHPPYDHHKISIVPAAFLVPWDKHSPNRLLPYPKHATILFLTNAREPTTVSGKSRLDRIAEHMRIFLRPPNRHQTNCLTSLLITLLFTHFILCQIFNFFSHLIFVSQFCVNHLIFVIHFSFLTIFLLTIYFYQSFNFFSHFLFWVSHLTFLFSLLFLLQWFRHFFPVSHFFRFCLLTTIIQQFFTTVT
jgi:hypothetical protein